MFRFQDIPIYLRDGADRHLAAFTDALVAGTAPAALTHFGYQHDELDRPYRATLRDGPSLPVFRWGGRTGGAAPHFRLEIDRERICRHAPVLSPDRNTDAPKH